jgi:putative transposase
VALRAYQRRTKQADSLIAGAYLLDGTVVRVRLDRKATSIVLLVVLGVREDGQKVLLAVKNKLPRLVLCRPPPVG